MSRAAISPQSGTSIVAALREGRTIHDDLTKVIAWTLPTNGGER